MKILPSKEMVIPMAIVSLATIIVYGIYQARKASKAA